MGEDTSPGRSCLDGLRFIRTIPGCLSIMLVSRFAFRGLDADGVPSGVFSLVLPTSDLAGDAVIN